MAEARGRADTTDRVPGLYRYLTEREQRDHDQPDPRVFLGDLDPVELAEMIAKAAAQPVTGMLAALKAGVPVVIPAWLLRGHRFGEAASRIPWLAEARDVVVHADDTITMP